MAKRRIKRLVPPGKAATQAGAPVTSLKLARKLTSKFHALLNEETALRGDGGRGGAAAAAPATAAAAARLRGIQAEMDLMGGRAAYQEASALSTRAFRSSRYVYKILTRLGLQPPRGAPRLRVLEVGAVNGQLSVCPWMDVRAIDLRSCDPHVEERDFFDVPVTDRSPAGDRGPFDVVCNAMVVNCVPDPVKRAHMLVSCRDHLRPGGLLFLAVPSRCVDMSQHLTRGMLETFLAALGFSVLDQKRTPKISFYTLRRDDVAAPGAGAAGAGAAAAAGAAVVVAAPAAGGGGKRKREEAAAAPVPGPAAAAAVAGGSRPPAIAVASHEHAALLARLAPPVRMLPQHALPITGFTLTDFALAVPPAWVRRVPASARPPPPPLPVALLARPPPPAGAAGAKMATTTGGGAGGGGGGGKPPPSQPLKAAAGAGARARAGGSGPAGTKATRGGAPAAKPQQQPPRSAGKAAAGAAPTASSPATVQAADKPRKQASLPPRLVAAAAANPTLAAELGARRWGAPPPPPPPRQPQPQPQPQQQPRPQAQPAGPSAKKQRM